MPVLHRSLAVFGSTPLNISLWARRTFDIATPLFYAFQQTPHTLVHMSHTLPVMDSLICMRRS